MDFRAPDLSAPTTSAMEPYEIQELVTSQWRATLSYALESGHSMIIAHTTNNHLT